LDLPYRQLVKQGPIFEAKVDSGTPLHKVTKNAKWRPRYYFLLNDVLLSTKQKIGIFTSKKKTNQDIDENSDVNLLYQQKYNLKDMEVVDLGVTNDKSQFFFGLKHWKEKDIDYVYYTTSEKDKEDWMQDIDDVISSLLKNICTRMDSMYENIKVKKKIKEN